MKNFEDKTIYPQEIVDLEARASQIVNKELSLLIDLAKHMYRHPTPESHNGYKNIVDHIRSKLNELYENNRNT